MANVLVQDGAGVAKYLKATGDGSNGDPFVVQHLMGSGATDDAAAAGELYPIAGLYQGLGSIDYVDTGDIARIRVTGRRALITGVDTSMMAGASGGVHPTSASGRDIQISHSSAYSGFSDIASSDFQHSSIDTNPFWFRVPMIGWKRGALVHIYNALGVDVTFQLLLDHNPTDGWSSRMITRLDQYTLPNGSELVFAPYATGSTPDTTVWRVVPAMLVPTRYLVLRCEAAADPTTNYIQLSIVR